MPPEMPAVASRNARPVVGRFGLGEADCGEVCGQRCDKLFTFRRAAGLTSPPPRCVLISRSDGGCRQAAAPDPKFLDATVFSRLHEVTGCAVSESLSSGGAESADVDSGSNPPPDWPAKQQSRLHRAWSRLPSAPATREATVPTGSARNAPGGRPGHTGRRYRQYRLAHWKAAVARQRGNPSFCGAGTAARDHPRMIPKRPLGRLRAGRGTGCNGTPSGASFGHRVRNDFRPAGVSDAGRPFYVALRAGTRRGAPPDTEPGPA